MVLTWGRRSQPKKKPRRKKNIKTTTYKNTEIWERRGVVWKHMKEVQEWKTFFMFQCHVVAWLYVHLYFMILLNSTAFLCCFMECSTDRILDLEQVTQTTLIDFPTLTSEVILMKTFRNVRFVRVKRIIRKRSFDTSPRATQSECLWWNWDDFLFRWSEAMCSWKVLFMFISCHFLWRYEILYFMTFQKSRDFQSFEAIRLHFLMFVRHVEKQKKTGVKNLHGSCY